MIDFLLHILSAEESDRVQAVLVIGLAKLVLAGMVGDEKVLKSLVAAYVSPDTADNLELRQCLSYFLPAYCYASCTNQRRMQQVCFSHPPQNVVVVLTYCAFRSSSRCSNN